MLELKSMTDQELAQRAANYIVRLEKLMDEVSTLLERRTRVERYQIDIVREKYRQLKHEIKADAHYVGLDRNENRRNKLYTAFFSPSVREAAAYGFASPTNSKIDHQFFSSIEEAHYKMRKYYGLDAWKKIIQS